MLVPRLVAEYRAHGGGEAEGAEDGEEHAIEASEGVREEERGVPGGVRVWVGAEEGEGAALGGVSFGSTVESTDIGEGKKGEMVPSGKKVGCASINFMVS